MASFKCDFNPDEIVEDILKTVETTLKSHPEEVLDDHVGETVAAVCPACGNAEVVILRGGKARCPKCGHTDKVNLKVNWR